MSHQNRPENKQLNLSCFKKYLTYKIIAMDQNTASAPIRVLIVEDLPSDALLAEREILKAIDNAVFECVETEQDFIRALEEFDPDIIVSDYQMPYFDGLSALEIARVKIPLTPFIVHTGSQNEDTAVACMKAGATDYVLKERIKRLGPAVKQALENKKEKIEKIRIQNELKESENRFRRLAENADDLIYRYEFLPERRFAYVSPSAYRITGYTPGEHYADPDLGFKLVHPDDREILQKLSEPGSKQGESITLRWVKKDGSVIWTEQKNVIIRDNEGRVTAIEGIARDISQRKETEEKLEKALKKAEESDRLKTAFLNNLSHEIRTPLNSIMGFSNLLADGDFNEESLSQYVGIINKSGKKLLHIINDIISISSIETGQEELNEDVADLKKSLDELYDEYIDEIDEQKIKFYLQCSLDSSEAKVICDWYKLEHALGCLLDNAIRFTEKGEIRLECSRKDDRLWFRVIDTGQGIDPEHHAIIFDSFRQVTPAKDRVVEGTGLGLSIAKSYIEMMGGEISLDSEPGRGSTFSFYIPYKAAEHYQAEGEKFRQKSADREYTLLVAEDEPTNYLLIESILESYPYRLIHVTNGEDAVKVCRKYKDIDLVIMDIKMPLMNGLEATRIIKKEKGDIPVLAVTAHALEGDREKAIDAGCDDYLTKPLKKGELVEKINSMLGAGF